MNARKGIKLVKTQNLSQLVSAEIHFSSVFFSGERKLQIWRQVLDIVTFCFWCPFCIWISEKQMHKKCRNVRDLGNSVQHWIYVVVKFLVLWSKSLHVFLACILVVPCLCWYVTYTYILAILWRVETYDFSLSYDFAGIF